MPKKKDFEAFEKKAKQFTHQPKFSIVIPVFRPNLNHFKQAIESINNQLYSNWEVCIADDNSKEEGLLSYLRELEKNPKFKVIYRTENGHISACSNSALELATGDFICFMDHDDLLTKDALFQFADALNLDSSLDIIYSDEDKITEKGRYTQPNFKPNWSPDTFLSRNYIGHFVRYKKGECRPNERLPTWFRREPGLRSITPGYRDFTTNTQNTKNSLSLANA